MELLFRDAVLAGPDEEFASIPPVDLLERQYHFSDIHEMKMKRIFARLHRRECLEKGIAVVKVIAIIVLVLMAVTAISLYASPEVRAQLKAWIAEWKSDRTEYRPVMSEDIDDTVIDDKRFCFDGLPDGYSLAGISEHNGVTYCRYENNSNEWLLLIYNKCTVHGHVSVTRDNMLCENEVIGSIVYHKFISENSLYPNIIVWETDGYLCGMLSGQDINGLLDCAVKVNVEKK